MAVLEEAQSVLGEMNDQSPFVRWTKEVRKYQLGSILVTQQPASIAPQLLSQGDNFFAFHLISAGDLEALQRLGLLFAVGQPVGGSGKGQQRLVLLLRSALTLKEGRRFLQYQGPELVAG